MIEFSLNGTGISFAFVVVIALGAAFIIIPLMYLLHLRKLKATCTLRVSAVVADIHVRVSTSSDGCEHAAYHPVFRYSVNGVEFVQEYNVGSTSSIYEIGDEGFIMCDPRAPSNFYIPGDPIVRIVCAIFLAVGVAMLVLGAILAAIRFNR